MGDNANSPSSAVIITGASSGIGAATARRLAADGMPLLLVDRDEQSMSKLVQALRAEGATVSGQPADVTNPAHVQAYVARAIDLYGTVHGLVNSAGIIGELLPLIDYPEDVFDAVVAVNLRGVYLGLKYVLPVMYERQQGSVVNMASVAGIVGHTQHAGYVASKHAVVGLTKVAGAESAAQGVRVNCIAPGPTRTQMMDAVEAMKSPDDSEAERRRLLDNIPAHRYGTADEIAAATAFLISDSSCFINGSVLTVDGAFTAIR